MKTSPTLTDRAKRSSRAIAVHRKVKPVAPQIFVRVPGKHWGYEYRAAHLRNKAGYLYLCWRDKNGIHSFYLGKAPKTSPTNSAGAGDGRELQERSARRAKSRGRA